MGRARELQGCLRYRRTILIVLVALFALFGPPTGTQAAEISRYQSMSPPPITADAVFVTDTLSGTELIALNADAPLPPASLTKIVSALVILERANLDDIVEILGDDLVSAEESQVGLVAGDRLTVRDLLFGMLIPSGNDATLALARYVGASVVGQSASPDESVAEFVTLMNQKAAELGASASQFANPTGIDGDGNVMSARDVAIVTTAALEDPLFREIVATTSAVLESEVLSDGYAITTTNTLLLEGVVTGVKTGTTPLAGGCLVTSFTVGSNDVVAVVLGSDIGESSDGFQDNSARFVDTKALLEAVRADYVWLDPVSPGVVSGLIEELSVWQVDLAAGELLPVPATRAEEVRYRLVLEPPGSPEDPAGHVQFYVGEQLLSERAARQAN